MVLLMTDGTTYLLAGVTTAIGSAASWFFSRWYYSRSGSDLDAALRPLAGNHQKLLQATNAIGRMLQQSGIGEPAFDAAGNLTGIVLRATASGGVRIGGTASATVTRAVPSQYDRQNEQPPLGDQGSDDA